MNDMSVVEKDGKFIVTKNGEAILLPKSDGQSIITEFDTKSDAERYMSIVSMLQRNKRYKK